MYANFYSAGMTVVVGPDRVLVEHLRMSYRVEGVPPADLARLHAALVAEAVKP